SALPGDRFEVRMDFSEPPPAPLGYTIEQPARIVLDFPGVESGLEQNRFPLSLANAKSAMVLEGDGRTRLVLNLAELTSYTSRSEGNALILEVGTSDAAVARSAPDDQDDDSTPPVSAAMVADRGDASE